MKEDIKAYEKIYNIFFENVLKAIIISEVKKTILPKQAFKDIKKDIETIEKKHGIGNIASSQSIVTLVSAMEAYLRDSFIFLINVCKDDKELKERLIGCNKKVELSKLYELENNECTIGDIIAENYSFQNLDSIHNAYELFDIGIFECLNMTKDGFTNGRLFLDKAIAPPKIDKPIEKMKELLELRHKVTHKSFVVSNAKNSFDLYIVLVQEFINNINDLIIGYLTIGKDNDKRKK